MLDFNIVTYHTAQNYGAVLQALGLQEFIRELGYSSSIYNFRRKEVPSFQGKVGKIYKVLQGLHKSEYIKQNENYDNFRENYLDFNDNKECKIFLAGSDQVWNPIGAMYPAYFLRFALRDTLKASYAASMGTTKIPEMKKPIFEQYIKDFDYISVRELDVKKVISNFCDKEISVNIDPTLLHNVDFWRRYEEPIENLPSSYILVYILHFSPNTNKLLKWLQKSTNKKIVLIDSQGLMSVVVRNDITIHSAGPGQFLWLFDNASSVVTTSFHGTAFSLIFEKEFYAIVNPNSPSRIKNLLELFDMKPITEDMQRFKRNNNINWDIVRKKISDETEKSKIYIHSLYLASNNIHREELVGNISVIQTCTGCATCESICPTNAIQMKLNSEGFYSPYISIDKCVNCSKCIRRCPETLQMGIGRKKAWYGWHEDPKVTYNSSSGGAFRAIADKIRNEKGLVVAATFDEDYKNVVFSDSDSISMNKLQKSKYTVSNPSCVYKSIERELKKGRKVLFCGTPCQCAGLTSYLDKEYTNLTRCDFVCGGMSSLIFYQEHLKFLENKFGSSIKDVDFRPKNKGWGKQRIRVAFENGKVYEVRSHMDSYFKCFANLHVSVRDTCLSCKYSGDHVSDITLADFWGYKNAGINVNSKGLSLIVANTENGAMIIESCGSLVKHELNMKFVDYAFQYKNPNIKKLQERNAFFDAVREMGSFELAADKMYPVGEWNRIKEHIRAVTRRKR